MADVPSTDIQQGLCPVCEASVAMNAIERHVDNCLRKSCLELCAMPQHDKSIMNKEMAGSGNTSSGSRKRQSSFFCSNLSPKQPKLLPKSVSIPSSTETVPSVPLYETMRPSCLDDFIGHEDIMGKGSIMKHITDTGSVPSLILWGPPGCGKV